MTTPPRPTADGSLVRQSRARDGDRFAGAVVGSGCLGVITELTLAVEPTHDIRQSVYEGPPFARVATDLDEILSAGYSVSLFTT